MSKSTNTYDELRELVDRIQGANKSKTEYFSGAITRLNGRLFDLNRENDSMHADLVQAREEIAYKGEQIDSLRELVANLREQIEEQRPKGPDDKMEVEALFKLTYKGLVCRQFHTIDSMTKEPYGLGGERYRVLGTVRRKDLELIKRHATFYTINEVKS